MKEDFENKIVNEVVDYQIDTRMTENEIIDFNERIIKKLKSNMFMLKLENGWDNGVEWYGKNIGENKYTKLYWLAYNYMIDNDCDEGLCFAMREYAIKKLIEELKGEL